MASIEAKNINHPEYSEPLNEKKYKHIKGAILSCLQEYQEDSVEKEKSGMSFSELEKAVVRHLKNNKVPQELFPKPGSVRWYTKAVQLDLEAKDLIERVPGKSPLRFRKK
jgi:hypothetical protein